MSHPTPTPPWGTPTGPVTPDTNGSASEIAAPAPGAQPQSRKVIDAMDVRVTALHYGRLAVGERGTSSVDTHLGEIMRATKAVETYLLTGQTG